MTAARLARRAAVWALALPVWLYRLLISPMMAPSCRFAPSCSQYALEALALHGPVRGLLLAARRIVRCHPWGGQGHDPVPRPRRQTAG